ncbi:LOB domain-containing protein 21 [Olea europaea subsp. europaea]|uniref:LOB domain-containing protein 21 n=1 Tax=Olea europaea subsp. europaea TaxID=158383 RepID=A0A8S0PMC6_OLEEU|nr:LOB domain-containing protein 21 [Olea europaea subsp. europaea]
MATNLSMHVCLHISSVITSETYLYVALPNMFNLHPAARIATPSELSTPTLESLFFLDRHMEFEFLIPEDARLRAHISQRSNLKYVKTVMDHFDERQREDFRNSPLGYLADIPDIQFSAQLILQLLFRTIHTEKANELLFNVQGHLMRFGLQEYAAMTGLRCGVFPVGDYFDRLIKRKRLKERYFKSNDKVWAFEVISEIGERFGQQVGERLPRILRWSARKQPQHRTYDTFFKNVQLHVYTTLRPTDVEAEQPYLSSLVPYDDPLVPMLDDISGGQDLEDRVHSGQSGDGETSGDDESDGESGSDSEGDDSEDTGDSSTPPGAPIHSPERGRTTNSLLPA